MSADGPNLRLPFLRLGEWMRRVGANVSEQPQLHYRVQPVTVLSDASALSPPWLPPTALFGTSGLTAAAGKFLSVCLLSRAPGGCALRDVRFIQAQTYNVTVLDALPAFTGEATVDHFQLGPEAVDSVVRVVALDADPSGAGSPRFSFTGTGSYQFGDVLYVPAGKVLVFSQSTAAGLLNGLMGVFQDYTAGPVV